MSDKAVSDAILALAESQLRTVEVLRTTESTTRVMAERMGRFCDRLEEYMQRSDNRHSDSERAIRVLDSRVTDVFRRIQAVEKIVETPLAKPAAR